MTPTLARMVAGKIHELPRRYDIFNPQSLALRTPAARTPSRTLAAERRCPGWRPFKQTLSFLRLLSKCFAHFGGEEHVSIKVNNRRSDGSILYGSLKAHRRESALATTKAIDARAKIGEEAYENG